MLKKIDNTMKSGNSHIAILYPGLALTKDDTGFHTLGRIDQARIAAGAVIRMHPHVNDDILSYFRSGSIRHTDSEGFSERITPTRLMLMKAGKLFYHEEAVEEDMEGLQIFIRPEEKDSKPEVVFKELTEIYSVDRWRLVASQDGETGIPLSSDTRIYDMKVTEGTRHSLPEAPERHLSFLLYVFQGAITVNENIRLEKGESLYVEAEDVGFFADGEAEIVLFVTNTQAPFYAGGMYSGNQRK
ncbi:MAG: nuclease PIN [Parapedobacter sp.]|nr:MAG: nuclease PIN [Parapedobacter sp.]